MIQLISKKQKAKPQDYVKMTNTFDKFNLKMFHKIGIYLLGHLEYS